MSAHDGEHAAYIPDAATDADTAVGVDATDAAAVDAAAAAGPVADEFYLRYYVGHRGSYGHEFLEFEVRPNGLLRYANNTNYKGDRLILKEVLLSDSVMEQMKRIVAESGVMNHDDYNWPEPNEDGRQDLEISYGNSRISFVVRFSFKDIKAF